MQILRSDKLEPMAVYFSVKPCGLGLPRLTDAPPPYRLRSSFVNYEKDMKNRLLTERNVGGTEAVRWDFSPLFTKTAVTTDFLMEV